MHLNAFSFLTQIFWKQIQALPSLSEIKCHGPHENSNCVVAATTLSTRFFEMQYNFGHTVDAHVHPEYIES